MSGTLTPPRKPVSRARPAPRRWQSAGATVKGLLMLGVVAVYDGLSSAQKRSRTAGRLRVMTTLCVVLTLVMGWRLAAVQLVEAEEYSAWAQRQTSRQIELPASRGAITDRDGSPLALSLASSTVYASPAAIAESDMTPAEVAAALSVVLPDSDVIDLSEKLTGTRQFVYIARQLPRDVGTAVQELELPGVHTIEEPTRVYPAGTVAGQVLGWAGVDSNGLAGIELQYNDVLAGTPGVLHHEAAPGGLEISAFQREVTPAIAGADVRLTIDREIQYATEQALLAAIDRYNAEGASAVVMDSRTGEILAMASVPNVSPEQFSDSDEYTRRNRAVTDVFEPGSVNKVITVAAAMEEGLVNAETWFDVPDTISIGVEEYHDSHTHATASWSTEDILVRSSNVGTIRIAQMLGDDQLHHYVTEFGLGQRTGLDFPGESRGILADPDDWSAASLPTIAIGQGVASTLVQTAAVYSTIANDGVWTAPSLVSGTVNDDGEFVEAVPSEQRQVVSSEVANRVAQMLVGVVERPEGTGHNAAVQGYQVGGKTGTAQKPSENGGGYEDGAFIGSFAGFAPAEDPRLVVSVMVDEPYPDYYGGLTAAPVFSEIMHFALRDQRIAPSTPQAALPTGSLTMNETTQDSGHSEEE